MHRVQTNAELEAFHLAGVGFVLNDFTSGASGAQYNVLHAAALQLDQEDAGSGRAPGQPSVRKMFFDTFDEAQSWLVANRGPEGRGWKRCGTCRPDPGLFNCPQRNQSRLCRRRLVR